MYELSLIYYNRYNDPPAGLWVPMRAPPPAVLRPNRQIPSAPAPPRPPSTPGALPRENPVKRRAHVCRAELWEVGPCTRTARTMLKIAKSKITKQRVACPTARPSTSIAALIWERPEGGGVSEGLRAQTSSRPEIFRKKIFQVACLTIEMDRMIIVFETDQPATQSTSVS